MNSGLQRGFMPDHPQDKIITIIVNWRSPDDTISAVQMARAQTVKPTAIYVVDNGSGDDSVDRLRDAFKDALGEVLIVTHDKNVGFGSGCNIAAKLALEYSPDYIWLLNNDARPAATCLAALLYKARSVGQNIGMVGSLLRDSPNEKTGHAGSWMKPWMLSCGIVLNDSDLSDHKYSWPTAASLLLNARAIKNVGLFDERFFMYWEDADLAMRFRTAGYLLTVANDAIVEHRAGTSSENALVQRYLWHFESQRLWLEKHHSFPHVAKLLLSVKFLLKAVYDRDFIRFSKLITALV
jgi:N-acetylglucosaminyl-diphospho-decaprenol L-rhamnosyltransferase